MYTEFMLCTEFFYKCDFGKNYPIEDDDNIINTVNEYILYKYKNKITDKINKEELLNILFEETDIKYLYITGNQTIIKVIKELEKDNDNLLYPFIFIKIKDEYKKYIYFKYDIKGCYDYFNKIVFCEKTYFNKDIDSYFDWECKTFICAYFDINKYYQDLILLGLNSEILKNKIIDNSEKFIKLSKK